MSKKRGATEVTKKKTPKEDALSAYDRLQTFVGIVDSRGLHLSTQTGKHFREALRAKSAEESERV